MTTSFASDSDNNFIIKNGEFVIVGQGAQVVQNVRENLQSYLDDFFLDRTQGVPYFQEYLTKPVDLNNIEIGLKGVILNTEGVSRLVTFSIDFNGDNRELNVATRFETIYGSVEGTTINV